MGKTTSRPIISYESAIKRLTPSEVKRIEAGFERLGVKGELRRSEFRTGFLNAVVGAPVPVELSEALFNSFDTSRSGKVTVQEFISGLAVLRTGSPEEKLQLLFNVYDADRDQQLSDRDLRRFAQALGDSHGSSKERSLDTALRAFAAEGQSVNYKRFAEWARKYIDSPLVAWLFSIEQRLAEEFVEPGQRYQQKLSSAPSPSSSSTAPVPSLLAASGSAGFFGSSPSWTSEEQSICSALATEMEIQDVALVGALRRTWRLLVAESSLGVIDSPSFSRATPSLPEGLRGRLFRVLDRSNSGTLSLSQWVKGVSICFSGSPTARREFGFHLFAQEQETHSERPSPRLFNEGADELRKYAEAAERLFSNSASSVTSGRSVGRSRSASSSDCTSGPKFAPPTRAIFPSDGFEMQDFVGIWAAEAEDVVEAIGCLLRVDLKIPPATPEEEANIVSRLNTPFSPESPGDPGAVWFLISARWWEKWYESAKRASRSLDLPPIDNTSLLDDEGRLRLGLSQGRDYLVIAPGAWRALWMWYGGPGPELSRSVVEIGTTCELEMYPLRLHVYHLEEGEGEESLLSASLEESCVQTVAGLREKVSTLACTTVMRGCLLHKSNVDMEWEEPENDDSTLHQLGFVDGHLLLILPRPGSSSPKHDRSTQSTGHLPVVGLQNLGNTCYMNSALQCLLHTPLLPTYFEKDYLLDLNMAGTWGSGGKLAVAFSELARDIGIARERGSSIVAPRAFLWTFTDLMRDFAGWAQQDAQEFLSVFLSGLSDDVNRVKEKPYVELQDSENRPDTEVATATWSAHCRREHSVIAALFSGQLKSTVRCSICQNEASTFDPFMSLQVPLPVEAHRWLFCNVVMTASPSFGPSRHVSRLALRVPKGGRVVDLSSNLSQMLDRPASELVVTEVVDSYVYKVLKPTALLATFSDDLEPVVYHVPPSPSPPGSDVLTSQSEAKMPPLPEGGGEPPVLVHFVHRRLSKVVQYFLSPLKPLLFGTPLLARLPAKCTRCMLYQAVWKMVRHLVPDLELGGGLWPFTLSAVKRDGLSCAACSWQKGCVGCSVSKGPCEAGTGPCRCTYDSSKGEQVPFSLTRTFSIDWDADILRDYYNEKIALHIHMDESIEKARQERKKPEELDHCLDMLVQEEALGVPRHCKACSRRSGEYRETLHNKQFKIWGCPPLLLLQLNRFHSRRGNSWKVHTFVDFSSKLDLRRFMAQEQGTEEASSPTELADEEALHSLSQSITGYELYGVVNHFGSMGAGHYTSCVKCNGRWYACSDDRVEVINEEEVVSAQAYLLFFARQDVAKRQVDLWSLFPQAPADALAADPEVVKRKRHSFNSQHPPSLAAMGVTKSRCSEPSEATSEGETSDLGADMTNGLSTNQPVGKKVSVLATSSHGSHGPHSPGEAMVATASRQRLECSNGHLIVKRKWKLRWHQHWLRSIHCALCDQRIHRDSVRWKCRFHCDYDVCGECYARRRRSQSSKSSGGRSRPSAPPGSAAAILTVPAKEPLSQGHNHHHHHHHHHGANGTRHDPKPQPKLSEAIYD